MALRVKNLDMEAKLSACNGRDMLKKHMEERAVTVQNNDCDQLLFQRIATMFVCDTLQILKKKVYECKHVVEKKDAC